MSDTERLLRYALAPVEPPGALTDRLEHRLTELTGMAADELADWELRAMRDPRNWVRPATAVVVGGAAAGALVLVRARQRQRRRERGNVLARSVREVGDEIRRRTGR